MARRTPKGIQDDIVGGIRKIVSPWLGAPPGQHGSVTKAQKVARGVAEGLDQAVTGGMVKAGVQGDKALAKQAAMNLAAGAVGAAAGAIVSKGLSRTIQRFTNDIGVHVSARKNLKEIIYSPARANTGLGDIEGSPLVHGMTYKISGFPADAPLRGYSSFKLDTGEKFTNKLFPAKPKLNMGFGRYLDAESMVGSGYSAGESQYGDTTWSMYVTKSKTGRLDLEKANRYDRITPKQDVLAEIRFPAYNKNEAGKFVNARQAAQIADQRLAEVVREIQKARNVIATRQNAVATNVAKVTGITSALFPKQTRGGGKNKR